MAEAVQKVILKSSDLVATKVNIPEGVEIIGEKAFALHGEMREAVFPASLTAIRRHAFEGCKKLGTLRFKTGLRSIGAKAFCDFSGFLVELPETVKEIAADAFPEGCVLSVGGEMPFYRQRLAELEKKRQDITAEEQREHLLSVQKDEIEKQLRALLSAPPEEIEKVSYYLEETERLRREKCEEDEAYRAKHAEIQAGMQECQTELKRLLDKRKHCFFLAMSRKRELESDIAEWQIKLQTLESELKQAESAHTQSVGQLLKELGRATEELRRCQAIKDTFVTTHSELESRCTTLNHQIEYYLRQVDSHKKQFETEEALLAGEHKKWCEDKQKATELQRALKQKIKEELEQIERKQREERERIKREKEEERERIARKQEIAALKEKKKAAIARLGRPNYRMESVFSPSYEKNALREEMLLNECYLRAIESINHSHFVAANNAFIKSKSRALTAIRKLNAELGLDKNDGIEQFKIEAIPEAASISLPERFVTLCELFGKEETWQELKQAAARVSIDAAFTETVFSSAEHVVLKAGDRNVLFFPYCIIVHRYGEQYRVFPYSKAKLSVKSREGTVTGQILPAYGEFISKTYQYTNKDGSADMRRKNNPIISTIRVTTIELTVGRRRIIIPVEAYQPALQLEEAYHRHAQALSKGTKKKIAKMVADSADTDAIKQEIDKLAAAEQARRAREQKAAMEAAKRAEEEQRRAQAAEQERRRAIIQRQRELNEERKRQAREQEELARRAAKLFDDDFRDEAKTEEAARSSPLPQLPVEVVGKRLISNTVFKVALLATGQTSLEGVTAYFVAPDGRQISNKKAFVQVTAEASATLGFILYSGVDYTVMKTCFLRLEKQGEAPDEIEFRMNISFCSDF